MPARKPASAATRTKVGTTWRLTAWSSCAKSKLAACWASPPAACRGCGSRCWTPIASPLATTSSTSSTTMSCSTRTWASWSICARCTTLPRSRLKTAATGAWSPPTRRPSRPATPCGWPKATWPAARSAGSMCLAAWRKTTPPKTVSASKARPGAWSRRAMWCWWPATTWKSRRWARPRKAAWPASCSATRAPRSASTCQPSNSKTPPIGRRSRSRKTWSCGRKTTATPTAGAWPATLPTPSCSPSWSRRCKKPGWNCPRSTRCTRPICTAAPKA